MDIEKISEQSLVAGQTVKKSGSTSLQKEVSRSATSTSRLANTSTSTKKKTTNGQATGVDDASVGMDLEASVAGQSMEKSERYLQKEAPESTGRTSTTTTATTTGMQKIDEGNEEEEEILGMKTWNWRKINLSFAIELNGQEGEDIRGTD
jgi:hypothetical protein